jgi:hypothetical protein
VKIVRRYGTSPAERGSASGATCPDILALDTGDYLIIGKQLDDRNVGDQLDEHGASIGHDEAAVIVPRNVVHAAVLEIAGKVLTEPPAEDCPTA